MRSRARWTAVVLGTVALGLLSAAPASADHHLVSVREVFPGSTVAGATSEFVELQMYAPGQTNFDDPTAMPFLEFYTAAGVGPTTFGTGPDVANGANQATALYATLNAEAAFGVPADFQGGNNDLMDPNGGAVCFSSTTFGRIDCVSWGTFDNSTLMLPVGINETGPIPDGASIARSIAPGCPTLLEAGDDTNDSQTDFSATAASPRNNTGAITEAACPAPPTFTPPGNPTSPINPAGNVRKRKCKKKQKTAAAAKRKKCKKKKKRR